MAERETVVCPVCRYDILMCDMIWWSHSYQANVSNNLLTENSDINPISCLKLKYVTNRRNGICILSNLGYNFDALSACCWRKRSLYHKAYTRFDTLSCLSRSALYDVKVYCGGYGQMMPWPRKLPELLVLGGGNPMVKNVSFVTSLSMLVELAVIWEVIKLVCRHCWEQVLLQKPLPTDSRVLNFIKRGVKMVCIRQ